MSFFEKLKNGLEKTKSSIFGQVNNLFKAFVKVDEDLLEELVGDLQDESDTGEGLHLQ